MQYWVPEASKFKNLCRRAGTSHTKASTELKDELIEYLPPKKRGKKKKKGQAEQESATLLCEILQLRQQVLLRQSFCECLIRFMSELPKANCGTSDGDSSLLDSGDGDPEPSEISSLETLSSLTSALKTPVASLHFTAMQLHLPDLMLSL